MKTTELFLYFFIILLLFIAGYHIMMSFKREGYEDVQAPDVAYKAITDQMKTQFTSYCKLATFVRSQMTTIYTTVLHESTDQANKHIQQAYRDVYACKDNLSSFRPSCGGDLASLKVDSATEDKPSVTTVGQTFIPCETFLNPPPWNDSNQDVILDNLQNIPDTLPLLITKEVEWYAVIIKKLNLALDLGRNPPSSIPQSDTIPEKNPSGKEWRATPEPPSKEGFEDLKCSPEAAKLQRSLIKKKAEEAEKASEQASQESSASSCTLPTPADEFKRIRDLLNSSDLAAALAKCNGLMDSMLKLQSDLQKAKDGNLYEWQQPGPKKSYAKFEGGDRTKGFIFSMQQNQQ